MFNVMCVLWLNLKCKLQQKRGQNTVEYLLMLTVIVGITFFVAAALKGWIGGEFIDKIKAMLLGATDELASR